MDVFCFCFTVVIEPVKFVLGILVDLLDIFRSTPLAIHTRALLSGNKVPQWMSHLLVLGLGCHKELLEF